MVIDASALVAILKHEPEREYFARLILRAPVRHMSPVNWLETAISASRAGPNDMAALDAFVATADIDIVPIDRVQMHAAYDAWRDYGKGQHPARLNLGDCFAYALAKSLNEPLLYKGGDFARTDVAAAV